ncbi:MAG: TonB-dependent receptor [Gammaproteobacteria bacterium]|nr:TonB-dependent receptor [Gammaproteobacteria bacterium]
MRNAVSVISVLSMTVSSVLAAEELGTIEVESTTLSDVSGEEVKSADLADALTKKVPGISIVRRSGIANDIILRGQKKDNINILIDNAKVYGACPNRMDPPTSHILTNTIDSIEITEGPYDVENFGTLSGAVKITTIKPSAGLSGEVSLNLGSFDYRKGAATVSGGNEKVRFLLSASKETSAQYKDGDGNTFYDQIANLDPPAPADVQYKDEYRDIDAYEKSSILGKVFIDLTDKQELRLSYTANRSDDVLYPSSTMDALYDDSNILNIEYAVKDLGKYSKSLDVQYYSSDVEHPMSTFYRNSSGLNSANEMISFLTTDTKGVKIKDSFDLSASAELTIGIDASLRNWDGAYEKKGMMATVITGRKSIDDVDTENHALFAEIEKRYSAITIKAGMRYDDTSITPANSITPVGTYSQQSNDYSGLSANVFTNFQADAGTRYFAGIGRASRVPDARELYFYNKDAVEIGTPTLDKTTNTEIDIGVEKTYNSFNIKTKLFHSWLKDYIYYNSSVATNNFENIDATIYGLEISGAYFASDEVYIDFGLAYQRGQKDNPLVGQTDTDLAEIPPMKVNVALNYDYGYRNTASIELVAADAWKHFDSDNGEQAISGYGVVNVRLKHNVTRAFELTAGIDNILDKTYAVTNTYKDLALLADGSGDVMLINEPGRYLYVNGTYKF